MLLDDQQFVVSALRRYEGFQNVATTRAIAFHARRIPCSGASAKRSRASSFPTPARAGWQRMPGADHVRNWMGVPLVCSGKVIGLYSLDKVQPGFFQAEHVRVAESLAARAASAIQNAQLFEQSQHYVAELEERSRNVSASKLRCAK